MDKGIFKCDRNVVEFGDKGIFSVNENLSKIIRNIGEYKVQMSKSDHDIPSPLKSLSINMPRLLRIPRPFSIVIKRSRKGGR
jgi:hypothetical protein